MRDRKSPAYHDVPERRGQSWSAGGYDANARFVSELGAGVVDWLAPRAGERILDLGCGDGVLTLTLMASGADVIGADSSPELIAAACARGVDARLIDGERLPFEREFDAVFSNAALHWMTAPERVAAGVARALADGGRYVGEFGGFGNVAAVVTALHAVFDVLADRNAAAGDLDRGLASPWYFPMPDDYAAVLEAHGFAVERIAHFARPTRLPTGIRRWLETMRAPFFDQFGERREEAYRRVEAALAPALRDSGGNWWVDYVRLRFAARLKG